MPDRSARADFPTVQTVPPRQRTRKENMSNEAQELIAVHAELNARREAGLYLMNHYLMTRLKRLAEELIGRQ
jgi:hypothetical protein